MQHTSFVLTSGCNITVTRTMAIPAESVNSVRVPSLQDKVYKDECMFSFDTPLSPGGLYTSLTTFQSFGELHVRKHFQKYGHPLYLRQISRRVRKADKSNVPNGQEKAAPTKLAIGVEGGFQLGATEYNVVKRLSVVCFPGEQEVVYPSDQIPENVTQSVEAILKRDGVETVDNVKMAWEDDERKESIFSNTLEQLPVSEEKLKVLSDPSQWACEESGMKTNIWLNLSTGHIGSGRRNWDGSGGTGAGLKHYMESGEKYPLAVKLGTITPEGADVFSYAENEMVIDSNLKQHLAHFGIDMDRQQKTERTMTEMQVDYNMNYDFSKITESGSELEAVIGPGFVGLENLGNSCYMASVLQLLFTLPEVAKRYLDNDGVIVNSTPGNDPSDDLLTMMVKMANGLLSDRYARPIAIYEPLAPDAPTGELPKTISPKKDTDEVGGSVRPFMFKRLIGRNHSEFSSARQQDASEFYQHLLENLVAAEYQGASGRLMSSGDNPDDFLPTNSLFSYELEERLECQQSRKSRYMTKIDNMLSLPIALDSATNKGLVEEYEERKNKRQKLATNGAKAEEEDPVKLIIPFKACVDSFSAEEQIDDFKSPVTQEKGIALKRCRFRTFPEYLVIQLRKYTYDQQTLNPKKLDVIVPMPEELDLEYLRSTGPSPDEQLLPESEDDNMQIDTPPARPQPDPGIVSQLMEMGFSANGSKRAALATNNAGAEAGMEYVFAHMNDPDFNDPIPTSAPENVAVDSGSLGSLTSMGFTEKQAKAALFANDSAVDRAVDWLFSQGDGLDAAVEAALAGSANSDSSGPATSIGKKFVDGPAKYKLLGFASHIGTNTNCGHYVAHIMKDGQYVLYNDSKVAKSKDPPTDLGFLYLYRRQQ